jgi:NAD(P)-dependent dehydrogenase (short-subunit alcohol dehydrogenase family)
MHFDMACTDQCQSLVRRVVAEHGRLDSLVVTAAADHRGGFLDEVTEWEWAYLLRTNLLGLVRLANEACIAIARSGGGSVVLIGSAAGLRGSRGHPAYALTKSTMTQVAQHLAVQWGVSAVRINCIAPSLIRTEFSRTIWADEAKAARALPSYPLGRFGEPDDVAGIAVALAGRAGAWITGQTIVVDGGMMAGVGVENIVEQRESFDVG